MAQVNNAASAALTPAAAGLDFSAPTPADAAPGFPEEFRGALEEFAKREQGETHPGQEGPESPQVDLSAAMSTVPLNLQILPPAALAAAAQAANLALDSDSSVMTNVAAVSAAAVVTGSSAIDTPTAQMVLQGALAQGAQPLSVPASSGTASPSLSALDPQSLAATQQPDARAASISPGTPSPAAIAVFSSTPQLSDAMQASVSAGEASMAASSPPHMRGANLGHPNSVGNNDAPISGRMANIASAQPLSTADEAVPLSIGQNTAGSQDVATAVDAISASSAENGAPPQAFAANALEQQPVTAQHQGPVPSAITLEGAEIGSANQVVPGNPSAQSVSTATGRSSEGLVSSAQVEVGVSVTSPNTAVPVAVAERQSPPTLQPLQADNPVASRTPSVEMDSMRVMALDIAKEVSVPGQPAEISVAGPTPTSGASEASLSTGTLPKAADAPQSFAPSSSGVAPAVGQEQSVDRPVATPIAGGASQQQVEGLESILDPSQATLDQRSADAARARQATHEDGALQVNQRAVASTPGMVAEQMPAAASAVAHSGVAAAGLKLGLPPVKTDTEVTPGPQTAPEEGAGTLSSASSVVSASSASEWVSSAVEPVSKAGSTPDSSLADKSSLAGSSQGIAVSTTATGALAGGDASAWVSSFTQALMGSGLGTAPLPTAQSAQVPLPSHSSPAPLPPHLVAFDAGPVQVEISKLVRQGGGQVVMELTPPDEGRFRVDLRIDAQGTATLIVEGVSDSTRSRLEQSAPDLREQFAQMGLQLELDMRGHREPSASKDHGFDQLTSSPMESAGRDDQPAASTRPEMRRRAEVHTGQVHLYA